MSTHPSLPLIALSLTLLGLPMLRLWLLCLSCNIRLTPISAQSTYTMAPRALPLSVPCDTYSWIIIMIVHVPQLPSVCSVLRFHVFLATSSPAPCSRQPPLTSSLAFQLCCCRHLPLHLLYPAPTPWVLPFECEVCTAHSLIQHVFRTLKYAINPIEVVFPSLLFTSLYIAIFSFEFLPPIARGAYLTPSLIDHTLSLARVCMLLSIFLSTHTSPSLACCTRLSPTHTTRAPPP